MPRGPTIIFHHFARFAGYYNVFQLWVLQAGYLINQMLIKSQGLCMQRGYYKFPSEPIIPEILRLWL